MSLAGLPTRLYEGKRLLERYEPFELHFDLVSPILDELTNTEKNVKLVFSKQLLMFAAVKIKDTKYVFVIGPVKSVNITNEVAKQIAISNDLHLSDIDNLKAYINNNNSYSIERFLSLLSSLNAMFNDEVILPTDIINIDIFHNDGNIYRELMDYSDYVEDERKIGKRFSFEHEKKLVFYVKNGMKDKINTHLRASYKDKQGIVAFEALRQYKNRCISFCTIVSRAAIEGGAGAPTCYQLCDLYCQRVEMCEKIEDMNIVMHSMLDDFCDRVQSTLSTNSDNPTIQRALHYINDNIHKKIKVEDIAKKLHINPSYLSSKFKKNTGISLPSYINAQKINEAKHLLAFSDKPIIEISNYLSFSSQSYFQNQFKKITGMTPIEYRNSEQ
jgi:AraC-like DNA-binding protein